MGEVVVTGIGLVTSIGTGRAAVESSLRELRHGFECWEGFAELGVALAECLAQALLADALEVGLGAGCAVAPGVVLGGQALEGLGPHQLQGEVHDPLVGGQQVVKRDGLLSGSIVAHCVPVYLFILWQTLSEC